MTVTCSSAVMDSFKTVKLDSDTAFLDVLRTPKQEHCVQLQIKGRRREGCAIMMQVSVGRQQQ